jgi:hypothetical protein
MAIQRMSFWEIGNEYSKLLSQLYDPETGEVNMEVDAQLSALSAAKEDKCIAITSWIKKLEAEKKEIEFMKQEVMEREKAYEDAINKNLEYLKRNMEHHGISEVKCKYFTIRIKKNRHSTDVVDESQIPERFMRKKEIVKLEIKADKEAIKEEVLRTGVQVPGAYVHQKTKLEILTDKI